MGSAMEAMQLGCESWLGTVPSSHDTSLTRGVRTLYTLHGVSWHTVGPQVVIMSIVAGDDSPLSGPHQGQGTHSQGLTGGGPSP